MGKCPPPLSGRVCLMSVSVGSLPLSKHTGWGSGTTPTFSARLAYLQITWGSDSPPLSCRSCYMEKCSSTFLGTSACPALFATYPFLSCLLIIQFFLWDGGQSVQGTRLIYPRGGCRSTTCHLFAQLLVCVSQAG
jgi:hypothetical protein